MTTKAKVTTIIMLGTTLMIASAQTNQTSASASASPGLSPGEQTIKDIKNPVSWMNWGGDFRVRNEYFDNLLTLNPKNAIHEQDYFRFRARLWATFMPVDDLSLFVRLAAEPREWMKPAGYTPFKTLSGLDMREGIIDNLWIQYTNMAGLPAMLKVGRQDLVPGKDSLAGDGWLLGDGTPADGSWTYYFDSARFKYAVPDADTTLEAMGIIQDPHDDAWLPTFNDRDLTESEQYEKGAIVQLANSSLKAANVAAYFIYKSDTKIASGGDDADIYTFGGRIKNALDKEDHWQYSAEGAYQFGRKSDTSIKYPSVSSDYRALSAYGFNGKLSYLFKDAPYNNQLAFSVEFLSGDDPKTGTDEMFDVLWGRWPRWSEIGLYSYAAETRIGQEANLFRFGPTWTVNPVKRMTFSTSYYALFSDENTATRGATGLFSNGGNFRGHFGSAMMEYVFSPHMKGHLWGEFLCPGNYYENHAVITFLRAELFFTF